MAKLNITHNKDLNKFEVIIEGETAFVEYKPIKDNTWSIPHTLVPPSLGGKGIASELVKTLLEHCKKNKIKVIPECSFVEKYIQRHPEWQELVMD